MFINDTHLPQILDPPKYSSQEHLDREMSELIEPGWQFIGTKADLPKDGSFFTLELFGKPLIIWRTGDNISTFLNVCPHRFAMLTHEPAGCCPQLVCQYHGWEFGEDGGTRKIPDATSFRPMKRGELGLTQFRTETCGQLIFVNFNQEGPDLKEFLGYGFDVGEELFAAGHRQILALDYELAANWKIKIENSLESYHVDMIHQATFIKTPDAADCEHTLQPRWTSFATTQQADKRIDRILDRFIHHVARVECDDKYQHYHFYPNLMYGKMRLYSFAETVFPIAPNRTRIFARFFVNAGTDRWQTRLLYRGMRAWGRKFWPAVQAEDAAVLPDIQKGVDCGHFPSVGLLSVREERLFHFQQYIHDHTTNGHVPAMVPADVLN